MGREGVERDMEEFPLDGMVIRFFRTDLGMREREDIGS